MVSDNYAWRRRLIFVMVSLTYVISYFHRAAPAVVGPVLTAELGLTPAQLGLIGSMYFWAYALTALPSGLLSDTWGARKTIAAFVIVAAVGGFGFAHGQSFAVLAGSRFLVGLGVGVVYVAAIRIFSDWYRPDELGMCSGLLLALGNIGALLSTGPLTWMMGEVGWRHCFDAVAALTVLAALGCGGIIRDRPGATARPAAEPRRERLTALMAEVFGDRRIYLLGALLFSFYGALMGVGSLWSGPFLQGVYGLSKQAAGNIIMLFPFGMVIGCPLAGWLSDRVFHSRRIVLIGGAVLHLLSYIPLVLCNDAIGRLGLDALFFWYGLSGSSFVLCFACIKEVYRPGLAGTAVGALNIFLFGGSAFYQAVLGSLLEMQAGAPASTRFATAFLAPVAGLVIGLFAFLFFKENTRISAAVAAE